MSASADPTEALRALLEEIGPECEIERNHHINRLGVQRVTAENCVICLARAALAAPAPTTETRKKTPRLEWHPGGTARVGWLEIQKWVPAGGERWAIRIDGFATEAEAKSVAEAAARGTR